MIQMPSGDENSKQGRVLVTGAAGFVGGYVARYLHRFGVPVRAMVRRREDGFSLEQLGIEVVVADLTDCQSLSRALHGASSVLHIAALFRRAGLPESAFDDVNVGGTENLLSLSVKHKIKRFIHCSTVGVHSNIVTPPGDETTPYAPADMYQRSKMEGEKRALEYFRTGKLRGVVIRPAMIYGPGDLRTLKLFRAISRRRFFYVGEGSVHVHFIDVRDLARAFALALSREDVSGEVFIIAGKESVPITDLVGRIAQIMAVPSPRLHLPVKPIQLMGSLCEALCQPLRIQPPLYRRRVDFFVNNRHFTSEKAERMLDFKPTLSLDQELREIVDWYSLHGWLGHYPLSNVLSAQTLPRTLAREVQNPFDLRESSLRTAALDLPIEEIPSENESVMVRTVEGTIQSWSPSSDPLYGWSKFEAEGRISHHILQTKFPHSLRLINQQLIEERQWQGPLRHIDRQGRSVDVLSSWKLLYDRNSGRQFVLESNCATAAL